MYPVVSPLVIGESSDFPENSALNVSSTFRSPTKFPQSRGRPQTSTNGVTRQASVTVDDGISRSRCHRLKDQNHLVLWNEFRPRRSTRLTQSGTPICNSCRAGNRNLRLCHVHLSVRFSAAPDSQYHAFPDFAGHVLSVIGIVGTRRIRYITCRTCSECPRRQTSRTHCLTAS